MGVTVLELATRGARPRQMGYISHVERNTRDRLHLRLLR